MKQTSSFPAINNGTRASEVGVVQRESTIPYLKKKSGASEASLKTFIEPVNQITHSIPRPPPPQHI
jgi:hypothetical protein